MLLTVGCPVTPIFAQRSEQAAPQSVQVDWPAVVRDVQTLSPRLSTDPKDRGVLGTTPCERRQAPQQLRAQGRHGAAAHLNELVVDLFQAWRRYVPVLVPFETARFLSQKARSKGVAGARGRAEQRGFLYGAGGTLQRPEFTGYDALITYEPDALKGLGIASTRRRMVHIAGAALSYGRAEAGELVEDLQTQYPGLRRQQSDTEVAYTFRKYGVPYFAIVSCSNRPLDPNSLKCEQAEALLRVAVRNLQLVAAIRCR